MTPTGYLLLLITVLPTIQNVALGEHSSGLYVDNGLGQTVAYRVSTRREKRAVARDIISLLDLPLRSRRAAKSSGSSIAKRSASTYLYEIYKNTSTTSDRGRKSVNPYQKAIDECDVVMTYSPAPSTNTSRPNHLWFHMSDKPKIEGVIGAELRVFVKTHQKPITVVLYGIMERRKNKRRLRLLDSVDVGPAHRDWVSFNATAALRHWLNRPKRELGFHLSVDGCTRCRELFLGGVSSERRAFLVGYFKRSNVLVQRLPRAKRSLRSIPRNFLDNPYGMAPPRRRSARSCQIRSLHVRFDELELDNVIVAPEGYDAQYCAGECRFPLAAHTNATKHAIVQTLVNFLRPSYAPKPCCVPTELDYLAVLYSYDGKDHLLMKYPEMMAKNCGCL